jgi:hypothetical protein
MRKRGDPAANPGQQNRGAPSSTPKAAKVGLQDESTAKEVPFNKASG